MIPVTPPTLPTIELGHWALQVLAMGLTCLLIPRLRVTSVFGPILMVLALGLVNSFAWSTALFFQIPDTLSSQAITLFLVNGTIFWILVKLLPGIEVSGILPALAAPVVFTVCSIFVSKYEKDVPWEMLWKESLRLIAVAKEYFASSPSTPTPNGH